MERFNLEIQQPSVLKPSGRHGLHFKKLKLDYRLSGSIEFCG